MKRQDRNAERLSPRACAWIMGALIAAFWGCVAYVLGLLP